MTKGYVGTPYRNQLAASGGSLPYNWTVTQGSLPPGLKMDSATGEITGMPNLTGRFYFTTEVQDSSPGQEQLASQEMVVSVGLPPLTIQNLVLPQAVINVPYAVQLHAMGGMPPYSWTVASGTLPSGLSLNPMTGIISGTPRSLGTFNVSIQVTDSSVPQMVARMNLRPRGRGPK